MLRATTTVTTDDRDMTLGSGKPIWYLEPERTPLTLEEFFVPLSNICRYNGAIDWRLIRHLALGIILIENDLGRFENVDPDKLCAYFAIHDLHEVIVGDMVSGMKKHFPAYKEMESNWETHVHEQLGYPIENRPSEAVRHYDLRALVVEMHMLEHPAAYIAAANCGGPPTDTEILCWHSVSSISNEECWDIITQAIE